MDFFKSRGFYYSLALAISINSFGLTVGFTCLVLRNQDIGMKAGTVYAILCTLGAICIGSNIVASVIGSNRD